MDNEKSSQLNKTAFDAWVAYRADSKHGPLTEAGKKRVAKRLERLGSAQQSAVYHSIASGYQGVYPPQGTLPELEAKEMAEDNSRLAEVLRQWGQVHRVTVTPNLVKAYREALKGLSHEQFERAVSYLTKHSQWFAKPSEIWRAAKTEGWL
jgi:hypothetical protein